MKSGLKDKRFFVSTGRQLGTFSADELELVVSNQDQSEYTPEALDEDDDFDPGYEVSELEKALLEMEKRETESSKMWRKGQEKWLMLEQNKSPEERAEEDAARKELLKYALQHAETAEDAAELEELLKMQDK
ncbi:hypothetical protein [Anaerovibrio sp. RM50]|uniref:hypothetical protein n=1 Tax=Anaerovibrio sp. RM50 TaxID=1200557 RepID=UPI00047FB84F|nr:hypothetical protein [Anaerovibrio sp. RM50]